MMVGLDVNAFLLTLQKTVFPSRQESCCCFDDPGDDRWTDSIEIEMLPHDRKHGCRGGVIADMEGR